MDVHHAAGAVGGDDHEAVMLTCAFVSVGQLADSCAVDRRPVAPEDQVGLLLRTAFIDPFKPVIDRCDCPTRPDRPEERAVGNFLDAGIDRRGAVLGPVRPPSPAHRISEQQFSLYMEQCDLGGGGDVVSFQWQLAN